MKTPIKAQFKVQRKAIGYTLEAVSIVIGRALLNLNSKPCSRLKLNRLREGRGRKDVLFLQKKYQEQIIAITTRHYDYKTDLILYIVFPL